MRDALIIIMLMSLAAVIMWNVIPSFRERLRGWSTVVESLVSTVVLSVDFVMQTIQIDGQAWSSIIPDKVWPYITLGVVLWFGVVKRVMTTTAVGQPDMAQDVDGD